MTLYFVRLGYPSHLYHGPDQKGKKRFQGKETAGCVPLGHLRKTPQAPERPTLPPQDLWSGRCRMPLGSRKK